MPYSFVIRNVTAMERTALLSVMPLVDMCAALLAVLAVVIGLGRLTAFLRISQVGGRHRAQTGRLAVAETLTLDAKRRLVIVRCDGLDCALLLGGEGDLMLGWLDRSAGTKP